MTGGMEMVIKGAIVDSWLEPSCGKCDGLKLVLQVAPQGRPRDLLIVEASASVVPDRGWLLDLQENLCHGSPVAAVGRLNVDGQLLATQIEFAR
jgi:hypothetical protein